MQIRRNPVPPNLRGMLVAVVIMLYAGSAFCNPVVTQARAYLQQIKSIKARDDEKSVAHYNSLMDEAWTFFRKNKHIVLPVLRKALRAELGSRTPNNLLLLDIGYFIRQQPDAADKRLAKQALFRLDSKARIIRRNQQELFNFAYAVVSDRGTGMLPFLDKTFLKDNVTAFVPQHALSLDETLVCVFLYGKYGSDVEPHLRTMLGDRRLVRKTLEILIWLGTPDSVPAVKAAIQANPSYDIFIRGTAFMMSAGGPAGRKYMLSIKPDKLDSKSRAAFLKDRKQIENVSYATLKRRVGPDTDKARLSDKELKTRLEAMYRNYGMDNKTDPMTLFNSGLSRKYLVSQLLKIRSRMFYRLSDEALTDVQVTNAILNTLYYK